MLSWLPTYLFLFIYHPKYDFFTLALPNRVGLAKLEGGGTSQTIEFVCFE
jgi:hypothetical protein